MNNLQGTNKTEHINIDRKLKILPTRRSDRGTQKCHITASIMDKLGCLIGSCIEISIKNGNRKYICTAWQLNDTYQGYIEFDGTISVDNCIPEDRCSTDVSTINKCSNLICLPVSDAQCIDIILVVHDLPTMKTYKQLVNSSTEQLQSMTKNCLMYMYLQLGCNINLRFNELAVLYKITAIHVCKDQSKISQALYVTDQTDINIVKIITHDKHEQLRNYQRMDLQLGGFSKTIDNLMDLMLQRKCNEFSLLSPQGVLLHGPPGCGKTSLVRLIAQKSDVYLISINGPEVLGSLPGESEANLTEKFQEAFDCSADDIVIIFIDEIDSLCPVRSETSGRSLTSQLLILLDQMKAYPNVKVIAATNRPSVLDPALRRSARFDRELVVGIPTITERQEIFKCLLKKLPLSNDVDIKALAEVTKGYVGADLRGLCQQAAYLALTQTVAQKINISEITMEHFHQALLSMIPSTQRGCDSLVDNKPVAWSDIGGLGEVKQGVIRAVEWPIKYPESFDRLGLPRPKGVLLHGPPGCCKTTLVRAAATSSGATFFSLSAAQLYSPFVGDSERILTEAFQRARMSSPSILFLDEIDAVVGKRSGQGSSGVQERLLSTLLNEMDGIGLRIDRSTTSTAKTLEGESLKTHQNVKTKVVDNNGVLVVAATNRPDMVDEAVLRPGRFDSIIYIPPPDASAREEILKVHTKKMPLSDDVDLTSLAEHCDLYTGADLENLCKEAALHALTTEGLDVQFIEHCHFHHVLSTYQPSLTQDVLQKYSKTNLHRL